MSVLRRMTLLVLPLLAVSSFASANIDSEFNKAELAERFAKLGLQVIDVVPADIKGLVEVKTNSGVLFASPDGEYFLAGSLYKLDGNGEYQDVIAQRQAPINAAKIEAMKDSVIEFKADKEKYVVTIFTDITCGYCVKLHNEMQGYNDLGISVRYMAFPRQGPVGNVADQMASIWCADDQQSAMHDGKVNRKFPAKGGNFAQCQDVIKQQYMLGRELGISGTPAIFLPNGEMVGGYLPPAKLVQRLEQK